MCDLGVLGLGRCILKCETRTAVLPKEGQIETMSSVKNIQERNLYG